MPGLVIGVDSSTTATKVEVRDTQTGQLVATGSHAHPPTGPPPRSEQDPGEWWAALVQAVHAAGRYDVDAIAVAGQQHGLVVLDGDDRVVRPAKLWNDTESAADAGWLVKQLGGSEAWADACGSVPVAAFTIAKLSWLHRSEPEAFGHLRHVLLPHDWLTWRLSGRFVTDRGDASGTGYWSPAENRWRPDLLRIVDGETDWVSALPDVLGPADAAGPLVDAAARPLGLDGRDVLVAAGTGDNMAAALGLGLEPGDVVISVGTSGTVYAVAERPTADPAGAVAGFADATGRFLPLVCTLNATRVTDAFRRLLGVDHAQFDEMALEAPAGAGGVVLVPYLDGERTPNRPDDSGTLTGLRSDTTREQLARAAVEGVVCGLLDGLDALRAAGVPTDRGRLFLVGGGARSAAYRAVVAGLAQRPVIAVAGETVARGACLQAATVLLGQMPAWRPDGSEMVDPIISAEEAAEVRSAYAAARG